MSVFKSIGTKVHLGCNFLHYNYSMLIILAKCNQFKLCQLCSMSTATANIKCFFLKVLEEATKAVKDEEAIKQNLCEDLNRLV